MVLHAVVLYTEQLKIHTEVCNVGLCLNDKKLLYALSQEVTHWYHGGPHLIFPKFLDWKIFVTQLPVIFWLFCNYFEYKNCKNYCCLNLEHTGLKIRKLLATSGITGNLLILTWDLLYQVRQRWLYDSFFFFSEVFCHLWLSVVNIRLSILMISQFSVINAFTPSCSFIFPFPLCMNMYLSYFVVYLPPCWFPFSLSFLATEVTRQFPLRRVVNKTKTLLSVIR